MKADRLLANRPSTVRAELNLDVFLHVVTQSISDHTPFYKTDLNNVLLFNIKKKKKKSLTSIPHMQSSLRNDHISLVAMQAEGGWGLSFRTTELMTWMHWPVLLLHSY